MLPTTTTTTTPTPLHLTPEDARLLINVITNAGTLLDLADNSGIPLPDLIARVTAPEFGLALEALHRVQRLAFDCYTLQARTAAIDTLMGVTLAAQDPPERRRAATQLIRATILPGPTRATDRGSARPAPAPPSSKEGTGGRIPSVQPPTHPCAPCATDRCSERSVSDTPSSKEGAGGRMTSVQRPTHPCATHCTSDPLASPTPPATPHHTLPPTPPPHEPPPPPTPPPLPPGEAG